MRGLSNIAVYRTAHGMVDEDDAHAFGPSSDAMEAMGSSEAGGDSNEEDDGAAKSICGSDDIEEDATDTGIAAQSQADWDDILTKDSDEIPEGAHAASDRIEDDDETSSDE